MPGQPGGPVDPKVVTKYGDLLIEKVKAGNASVKLDGAEFQIFKSKSDALTRSNPITLDSKTTFTTGADGKVMLTGLHVSDWANGAHVNPGDPGYQSYWLVETKAPAGYSLLAEPYEVVVKDYVAGKTTPDYVIEDALNNGGFQLPLTGSVLSASLFYGGGALIVLGTMLLVARQRKQQAAKI